MGDVSPWASVSKLVCNYFLGSILLNWNPFFKKGYFCGLVFWYVIVFFYLFLDESCCGYK